MGPEVVPDIADDGDPNVSLIVNTKDKEGLAAVRAAHTYLHPVAGSEREFFIASLPDVNWSAIAVASCTYLRAAQKWHREVWNSHT